MSVAENAGIELMAEMVVRLGKTYEEVTSHRKSLSHTKFLFEDMKQHFFNIQKSLEQKFDELETKERAFEEKKAEHCTLLKEREAAVTAKEQALWDRLQELKDAAVSAIIEARKKYSVVSPVLENKVSTSTSEVLNASFPASQENIFANKFSHSAEAMAGEVEPRPQLKQLCEQMNVKGLLKFFSENRKNIAPIRDELPFAMRSAKEPAHFVFKTLEGFYPENQSIINQNAKENSNLQVLRRTCLLLMESAAPFIAMVEPGEDQLLSSEIKKRAKEIADDWKSKLAELDLDASNGHSLEAQAFLQLLATFSISSEFDEDELCKLVIAMSRHRRQAPELCRAIGLAHKSQDVVEALITKGRLIDAVQFAHFFQLTEVFPLVPLLKQYLEKVEETCARTVATGLEKEAANQELSALKTVIRCIEEYKLQEEYPTFALQNRIEYIERNKVSKKRTVDATKFPVKRYRANDGYPFRRCPFAGDNRITAPAVYDERSRYYAGLDRFPDIYPYTAPPPYEASGHVPYGHQVNVPRPHHYPDVSIPPYGALTNYGSYIRPSMQSAPSNYMHFASSSDASYLGSSVPSSQQSYM